jgi:hypothetical protein
MSLRCQMHVRCLGSCDVVKDRRFHVGFLRSSTGSLKQPPISLGMDTTHYAQLTTAQRESAVASTDDRMQSERLASTVNRSGTSPLHLLKES